MPSVETPSGVLEYHPLTEKRWDDFVELFGPNGAYSGCWCMWWRQTRAEFDRRHGDKNREAMRQIVQTGEVPGIVAYRGGRPIGWCSVAPREAFGSLNRSRVLKALDDTPVWSIVCFFVARSYRGRGLSDALIRAAVAYVREQGGQVVESYPTVPKNGRLPPVSSFMGLPAVFEGAGFEEYAQPSESKVIMRYYIK